MEVRLLGPLEVVGSDVSRPQQRALLALLALHRNRVVATGRLITTLWDHDGTPAMVQGAVARLRRALGPAGRAVLTRPPGYTLRLDRDGCDADRFEALVARADALVRDHLIDGWDTDPARRPHAERAVALLTEAESLWRGPVLEDLAHLDALTGEVRRAAGRLTQRRLDAVETRAGLQLRLGHHADLPARLAPLVAANPTRERLCGHLMVALQRCGRPADALALYERVRAAARNAPGPALADLHDRIRAGADPLAPAPGAARTPGAAGLPGPGAAGPLAPARGAPPEAGTGATASAASRAPVVSPAQLPGAIAGFVGRRDALSRLDGVGTAGIAVLTGTAGVGKTALALHWAHGARDRFPDGQLYADLHGHSGRAPVPAALALTGFLTALGVEPQRIPPDEEAAAALYRSVCAGRRLLVVLDNAAEVDQVRPLLPGVAGCLVLVTSRSALPGLAAREGATTVPLGVLSDEDARALLADRLGEERVRAEPVAVTGLIRACAGLPLALRIAAANIAAAGGRLADHVADLTAGDRLDALAVSGDEHSAVRVAFDRSYERLDDAAQRMFRLLGLLPGARIGSTAAAALADLPPAQARRLLDRLATAHLVERRDGRVTMHDLLAAYAAEKSERDDERSAAADRLAGHYLALADAAARAAYPEQLRLPVHEDCELRTPVHKDREREEPAGFDGPGEAVAWLAAELATLVLVVRHAAAHGPHPHAWRLADALRGYLRTSRAFGEWRAVAEAGRAAARAGGDRRAEAAAELSLADLHQLGRRYPEAIDHYTRAAGLAHAAGWTHGEAAALGNLGGSYWYVGRLADAAGRFRTALALNRSTGWLAGQVANLGSLGMLYDEMGRTDDAGRCFDQAATLFERLGSRGGRAHALARLGRIRHLQGRSGDAEAQLTAAAADLDAVGDRASGVVARVALAAVHRDAGRIDAARQTARDALALAREVGDARLQTEALHAIGSIEHVVGQHRAALGTYQHGLELARQAQTTYPQAVLLLALAEVTGALAGAGRTLDGPGTARSYAREALTIAGRNGYEGLRMKAQTLVRNR